MLAPDDIDDLRWFFSGEAEAAAGVRSGQGGFEATMHRLALCGRPAPGDVPVRETRATASQYDIPVEHGDIPLLLVTQVEAQRKRKDAIDRLRKVQARLLRISPGERSVLELQYGGEATMGEGGITVALACSSTTARHAYRESVEALNRRLSAGGKASEEREKAAATQRLWLIWLAKRARDKDGAAMGQLLERILQEARAALGVAERAYQEAKRG